MEYNIGIYNGHLPDSHMLVWISDDKLVELVNLEKTYGLYVAGCGFVSRLDPPMCPRAKSIIPGLLVSLNKSQEFGATMVVENIGMGMKIKRLKMILFVSCDKAGFKIYKSATIDYDRTRQFHTICNQSTTIANTHKLQLY
ncbi:hypothetical protein QVD17_37915 [Tagetes erecta]|uniref:Uncharacterized protein n=1 Tax=Tagetes erecta TaxID=13708 RepID=A0AAD8JVK6_TARER|nr:hypothetical protein QVD17_37915 [Tagetes erecta]